MVTRFEGITWTPTLGAGVKQNPVCALVHAALRTLPPDLVVCPAGLPHAQSLGVRELPFEAQQDPAVAEEQLEAVLPQPGQVLVEAGQHETQQLPQVHLEAGQRGRTLSYTNTIKHSMLHC